MKRVRFISQAMWTLVSVVLVSGGLLMSSCSDDDEIAEIVDTRLDTPENVVSEKVTAYDASFNWGQVKKAFTYTAQLKLNKQGSVVKETIVEAPLHNVLFVDLEPNTTYYFRVRANDEFSESKDSHFSEWLEITTDEVLPQHQRLDVPQNVINLSDKTTGSLLAFRWDVVENAASYTWKLSDASGERAGEVKEGLNVSIGGLEEGVEYTFQVRANPKEDSEEYTSSAWSAGIVASTIGKLASPVVESVLDEATINSLKFTWDEVEGADTYVYVVSEDGGKTYGEETTTTHSEVVLTALAPKKEYFIKVKAIPVEGSVKYVESEYSVPVSGTTISADATELAVPVIELENATTQSLTIKWGAVENATGYKYQFGEGAEEVQTTETSVTFKDLTENTEYKVRVMAMSDPTSTDLMDSPYSEWSTFKTEAPSGDITVATVDEFRDALISVVDGGTITLKSGNYFINTDEFAPQTVEINKSMTIRGADSEGARINAKLFSVVSNIEFLTFENIEFSGFEVDAEGVPTTTTASDTYFVDINGGFINHLTIKNCFVHNIINNNGGVIRANRSSTGNLSNLTVENNRFYNSQGGLIRGDKAIAPNSVWIIKNNTITGAGAFSAVAKSRVIQLPRGSGADTFTATISNNTFYNIFSADNMIDCGSTSNDCGVIVVEKNVVHMNPDNTSKGPRLGGNAGSKIGNNAMNQVWTSLAPSETDALVTDLGFQDYTTIGVGVPADANFAPPAEVKALGYGDPRWN